MTPAILAQLLAARADNRAVVLATRLADGAQCILPNPAAAAPLADLAAQALARDENRLHTIDGTAWFLHVYAQPYRLLIIGAVHAAQALASLAQIAGFAVTIIDPRRHFATVERFADVALNHDWPDEALAKLAPNARTAVVALTHDPKLDDPGLDIALHTDAFFIGALGSRKTHAARLTRLAALGHDATTLARIRGPVGLPIGAVSAAEIGVSIVAEIIAVRRHATLATKP